MCPNREWFSTYSSVEGGVVHMGNDSSNLKGCRINIESSSIKVSRGALVLLKGKRTGSLYILEGSTVIGEIGRPSSVTELKSTCLEQRQLGHRREKCMTVSLKRGSLLDTGFEKLGHCVRENQTQGRQTSREVKLREELARGKADNGPWMAVEDTVLAKYARAHGEGNWNLMLQGWLIVEVVNVEIEPAVLRQNPTLAQMKQHSEECAKKHNTVSCLQNDILDMIFTRIVACDTPKQAWDKLEEELQGSQKIIQQQMINLR
ncbi:hypothetical protein PVK06_001901 [Gossypium arboreum]|uniref:Uncharacterized protein n=1 Tax=Gossypium arboreum TaxID=29729 RepID=A0ABR0R3K3_GOSAR|nr:hypothetical protein PVK06_001901 [Gossypium arboreum]